MRIHYQHMTKYSPPLLWLATLITLTACGSTTDPPQHRQQHTQDQNQLQILDKRLLKVEQALVAQNLGELKMIETSETVELNGYIFPLGQPAREFGLTHGIQLMTPVLDPNQASGHPVIDFYVLSLPEGSEINLVEHESKHVTITGSVEWSVAESRVIQVESVEVIK